MRKTAVLCSIDSWGGLEINTFKLCLWLHNQGKDICLVGKPSSKIMKLANENGIPTLEFAQKKKHLNLKGAKRLAKLLDAEKISNLLISHYHQFYSGILAKFFTKSKLTVSYWQQMQMPVRKRDLYHTFFYKHLDRWVSPLAYLEEQLLQNSRIKKEKIRRIPLCIDMSPFIEASKKDKSAARETFSLPKDDFIIGVIGRLDKQKGQEYLIKALPKIKGQIPNLKVIIIGEETYGEEGYLAYLKDLVSSLEVEDLVIFHPFTQDTPTAFRAFDIFMMSSLSEPFGMVTVEAMATGTPVIGTNSGGTIDLLENGKLGILVEPKNEEEIAKAITKIYNNEELRNNFSKEGQKVVQGKYSHLTQCALFEKVFNEFE